MKIKVKTTWKDHVEKCGRQANLTRRDFMARGLATGALSVLLPKLIAGRIVHEALAGETKCPPQSRAVGAIAQIFSEGGPTMGARFIGDQQALMMNATMASNYGISGQANLVKLGPNMNIDKTSPFGATLLEGPNGYSGGPAAWQSNVLGKLSGGGHLGPFNADDGGGENLGFVGGVSPFKPSLMGKDLLVGPLSARSKWANGLPSSMLGKAVKDLTTASLAGTFSMTPASKGLATKETLLKASEASAGLARIFGSLFQNDARIGGNALAGIGCSFMGNSSMADPNFGTSLFTASQIGELTSRLSVANLSPAEQAQLAAFYQSAAGVAGGVILEFRGRDYHGQDPASGIAPADIEEARSIVMFLAACEAAQAPGALIYVSNGQAIANGVRSVTASIGGTPTTLNAPVATGDAGGAYNAGLIIFYDPKGAPPQAKFTGTVKSTNGNAVTSSLVGSVPEAIAGLYLSALEWILGGNIPQSALAAMQAAGVAANPANIKVI